MVRLDGRQHSNTMKATINVSAIFDVRQSFTGAVSLNVN